MVSSPPLGSPSTRSPTVRFSSDPTQTQPNQSSRHLPWSDGPSNGYRPPPAPAQAYAGHSSASASAPAGLQHSQSYNNSSQSRSSSYNSAMASQPALMRSPTAPPAAGAGMSGSRSMSGGASSSQGYNSGPRTQHSRSYSNSNSSALTRDEQELETARLLSLQAAADARREADDERRAYEKALALSTQSATADRIRIAQLRQQEMAEAREIAEAVKLSRADKGKGRGRQGERDAETQGERRETSAERREREELEMVLAASLRDDGQWGWTPAAEDRANRGEGSSAAPQQPPPQTARPQEPRQRRTSGYHFHVSNPDEHDVASTVSVAPPAYDTLEMIDPNAPEPVIIGPGHSPSLQQANAPTLSRNSSAQSTPIAGPSRQAPQSIAYVAPSASGQDFDRPRSARRSSGAYYQAPIAALFTDSPAASTDHGEEEEGEDDEDNPFSERKAAVGHLRREPSGPRPNWAPSTESDTQTESSEQEESETDSVRIQAARVLSPPLQADRSRSSSSPSRDRQDLWGITHPHRPRAPSSAHSDSSSRSRAHLVHDEPESIATRRQPDSDAPTLAVQHPTRQSTPAAHVELPPSPATVHSASSTPTTPSVASPRLFAPGDLGSTPSAGGLVDTSSAYPPEEHVLDGVAWGFIPLSKRPTHHPLEYSGAFPDVVQFARPHEEQDKYATFAIEAPTWGKLLIFLCWYGNARLEASPTDLQRSKVLDISICIDVYRSYAHDSRPRVRARVDLLNANHEYNAQEAPFKNEFDEGCPNISLPLPRARRLPLRLSDVAEVLSQAHSLSRKSHELNWGVPGLRSARDLHKAVDLVKRIVGEEVVEDAEEEERRERSGMSKLLGRLKRLRMRGPGLVPGGADGTSSRPLVLGSLPEGAMLITPFGTDR